MSTDTSRLSFAKVAASAGKDKSISLARIAGSASRDPRKENSSPRENNRTGKEISKQSDGILNNKIISEESNMSSNIDFLGEKQQAFVRSETDESEIKLLQAVNALHVTSTIPNIALNSTSAPNVTVKLNTIGSLSEVFFHHTDTGSDLATKPPSFDDKSTTSGITFAIDEKESLRPDDSASAKAAEDDDCFSGRGSIVAGSRIGSEAAARAYRAQFHEVPERRNILLMHGHRNQTVTVAQSGSSGQQLLDDRSSKINSTPDMTEGFNLFYRQTPDEKLLEALDSLKDRMFLLRLEQEVIEFVRSSKEPFIDLPPCNSFCRMLTHKLADYYHLTHQVDAVAGAVRIFRTPFCRLPPSLTSLSNPPTSGNTPPPAAMKIMRRGGDSGPSPSKAASESGSDEKEKGLSAKEKLSREEREAAYNKARERIFGKEEKNGDATPETDDGNEISRSSSLSMKDRNNQSKKTKPIKQRRGDSESFDSRSQYTPFFPQPQGPTWISSAQYSPIAPQSIIGDNRPFQGNFSPQYVAPLQQCNPVLVNTGNMNSFNMIQPYLTHSSQRFQQHSAPNLSYGSPVQSPPPLPQQWSQPINSSTHQLSTSSVRAPHISIPYAFGQLPSTQNPADLKIQHPIPGSFNRHAFNPKIQSFVPGGIGIPMAQQVTHHGTPYLDSSHHISPHISYNAYNSSQQQYGNGNGMAYNMVRQSSKNSLTSYQTSPHMAHRHPMHQAIQPNVSEGMPHGVLPGLSQNHSQGMNMGFSSQMVSHLPNYGNPLTLPPKPPAGL